MAYPRPAFTVGQLWTTSTGRTVEIVAVDRLEEEGEFGELASVNVIAYRFVGGGIIHLRAAGNTGGWLHVNTG